MGEGKSSEPAEEAKAGPASEDENVRFDQAGLEASTCCNRAGNGSASGACGGKKTIPISEPEGAEDRDKLSVGQIELEMRNERYTQIRQQLEQVEALRQSERRLHVLLEAVTDCLYVAQVQAGNMAKVECGCGCLGLTGYCADEFAADPHLWCRICVDDDRDAVVEMVRRAASGRSPEPLEHRLVHKDGSERWVLHAVSPRREQGRLVGFDGLVRDITWRRHADRQHVQDLKMEAVARLASGIAHDIRNQLTVIKGFGEILDRMSLVSGEGLEMLHEVLSAAERAESVTSQLLAFSRKGMLHSETVDLPVALGEICDELRGKLPPEIRLVFETQTEHCPVQVETDQLHQAMLNLARNAADAMPDGGELRISLRGADVGDEIARRHGEVTPGSLAVLEIADTGVGMEPETASKMFEPFFSTKPAGEGAGLGLAVVYGFVKQTGGAVEVDTKPGEGTIVRIILPQRHEPSGDEPAGNKAR